MSVEKWSVLLTVALPVVPVDLGVVVLGVVGAGWGEVDTWVVCVVCTEVGATDVSVCTVVFIVGAGAGELTKRPTNELITILKTAPILTKNPIVIVMVM